MTPKLYLTQISPPCRAVLLTAKAIDLELELVDVNLLKREHLAPEFLKINPVHTVPVLNDDGLILIDSHAIMGYLVDKYSKDKSLYPEDVKERALINQRLYFEAGVFFARHTLVGISVLHDATKPTEKQIQEVTEAYGFVEAFLHDYKYIAGNNLSIADFSILTTITNANILVPLDEEKFPKISAWKKTMKTLPFYDINQRGNDMFRSVIEFRLKGK